MSGSDLCIPRNETARPRSFQNRIIMFCLLIRHSCICERFWEYINCSQIPECRNWERGAVQFHFWEYINRIRVQSRVRLRVSSKQTNKNSVQNETNRNKICSGFCFGLIRATKNKNFSFFSVCFGVMNLYRNNQNCFETNRKKPKQP
jgi:hypothetical protein